MKTLLVLLAALSCRGAVALVAHNNCQQLFTTPCATSGIDTTGATLLIAEEVTAGTLSIGTAPIDSKNNTWIPLIRYSNPSNPFIGVQFWYACNPTVGTGHTFTMPVGPYTPVPGMFDSAETLFIGAFSGVGATRCLAPHTDHGTYNAVGHALTQPGGSSPTVAGDLVIFGIGTEGNASISVSVGTLFESNLVSATGMTGGMAWLSATGTAAVNPSWTAVAVPDYAMNIVVFERDGTKPKPAEQRIIARREEEWIVLDRTPGPHVYSANLSGFNQYGK
jgi:hypothetical protein